MPEKPSNLTHAELLRQLRWSPETGRFTWLVDASHRIKAGMPAGLVTKEGRYVLTVSGQRYYGHRLAHFYATGEWPTGEPRFRDLDRGNCSADNLYFVQKTYSHQRSALAARKARTKKMVQEQERDRSRTSPIDGIVRAADGWVVYHPEDLPVEGVRHAVIGKTRSFDKAALLYYERLAGLKFVADNPPAHPAAEDLGIFAGDHSAISRAEALAWLAYDAQRGAFYHRRQHRRAEKLGLRSDEFMIKGLRADELNTNGTPVIGFFGRDYSAASLAIFMRLGIWPARRSVKFKDGDKTNIAWANIIIGDT